MRRVENLFTTFLVSLSVQYLWHFYKWEKYCLTQKDASTIVHYCANVYQTKQLHNSFWSLLSPLDLEKEMETTVEEVE